MSQTECLTKAANLIRNNDALDEDQRRALADALQATIDRYRGAKDKQFQRALLRMADARREIFVSKVTKVAAEAAEARLRATLERIPFAERGNYLRNLMEYDSTRNAKRETHIAGQLRTETNQALAELSELWDNIAVSRAGWISETEFVQIFAKEARGIDTGDPLAKKLAAKYREVSARFIERNRANGVWVEQMDNYLPQGHDIAKIVSDDAGWADFLRKNLDPDAHPDPEATIERVRTTLLTRGTEEEQTRTLTAARKLKWSSPEAEYEYARRYGPEDFAHQIQANLVSLVRNAVLAERLGPTPIQTVQRLTTELRTQMTERAARLPETVYQNLASVLGKAPDEVRRLDLRKELAKAQRQGADAAVVTELQRAVKQFDEVAQMQRAVAARVPGLLLADLEAADRLVESLAGQFATPVNQTAANLSAAMRNLMSFSMLGLTTLSQATVDATNMFAATRFSREFGRGPTDMFVAMREVLGDQGAREWAEDMGALTHAMFATRATTYATSFDAIEIAGGATANRGVARFATRARDSTQRLSTMTQRLSLSHQLDTTMRSAYLLLSSRRLLRAVRSRTWQDLPDRYRKMLEANAFDARKWQRLGEVATEREALGTLEVNTLPPDLRTAVMSMLYRETDLAITFPAHYDRLMLGAYQRPGTLGGEIVASATQFLSWPVAFVRGAYRRELQEGGIGKIGWAAGMVVAGGVATQLYAFANGEPMFEWDSKTLWLRGVARSGLLTPPVEVLVDATVGGRPTGLIDGPVISQIGKTAGGIYGAGRELWEGEEDKAAARLISLGKDLAIPNIWWAEYAVLSRLERYAIEELDPEKARRTESRFRQEERMDQ